MNINDQGGPAFPAQFYDERAVGMTLRDYFAIRALPTAIEHWKNADAKEEGGGNFQWDRNVDGEDTFAHDCLFAAEWAYLMADAMLKARK